MDRKTLLAKHMSVKERRVRGIFPSPKCSRNFSLVEVSTAKERASQPEFVKLIL